jgi:hypothetical protein
MRIGGFGYALSTSAAAALLAGCAVLPQSSSKVHDGMQPSIAARGALLYLAASPNLPNGTGYVYTYPQGHLVGTLTGFAQPFGECGDSAGNIFVVAYANGSITSSTIYEYAHGGTTPIAEFSDPNAAFGCAVDPTTGNLAAVGGGSIVIFTTLTPARRDLVVHDYGYGFHFCGYDNRGNLYISATDVSHQDQADLVRVAKGSDKVEQISLDTTLYDGSQWFPSVQWDGKHVTVTSNPAAGTGGSPIQLYRLAINGTTAKVIGTTTLESFTNEYSGQTWIQGKTVIGASYLKKGYQSALFWSYPKGGEALRTIRKIGDARNPNVSGVTVSIAP